MKHIIYVMKFWYLFLVFMVLSCSCLESRSPSSQLTFPDKKLEEVVVSGVYAPGGEEAMEKLKKLFLEEEEELKAGETIEEAIRNRYPGQLEEHFTHSGMMYCYRKTIIKAPVSNRNLKARLYNGDGEILAEDFLRFSSPDPADVSFTVDAYLPYHDGGHEIRIVRLEGTEEVVLHIFPFMTHSKLINITSRDTQRNRVSGEIVFNEKNKCHDTPGSR